MIKSQSSNRRREHINGETKYEDAASKHLPRLNWCIAGLPVIAPYKVMFRIKTSAKEQMNAEPCKHRGNCKERPNRSFQLAVGFL